MLSLNQHWKEVPVEKNGKIYCDECYLDIMQNKHRVVPREATASQPAGTSHFHNREIGDCWSKKLAKATAAAPAQMKLAFARGSGVIQ